jgi:outer membrane protein assembly factor BamB
MMPGLAATPPARTPGAALLPVTLALACAPLGCGSPPTPPAPPPFRVAWTFEPPGRGAVAAAPLVVGDHVFVAAIHDVGLAHFGAVYRLDRRSGRRDWQFDDGGRMQHMISTPCCADGRVYLGEGMHGNFVCKFYCLDADTGSKRWDFEADGHIESSPCVAGGAVFFGAGDDGVHALDAATGRPRWHFHGDFHVDASPVVASGHLYAGSGVSRRHRRTEAFCLDADTGRPLWRVPTDLPVWAAPAVDGADVFVALGNGRLNESAAPPETPRGALLRLDAATGRQVWRYDAPDGVLVKPALDGQRVYFGSRDGCCYALERGAGRLVWKQDVRGPVVAAPCLCGGRLYVAAGEGRLYCLGAADGRPLWTFDVAAHSRTRPRLFSAPVVVPEDGGRRRIYFGAELRNPVSSAAMLYCLED